MNVDDKGVPRQTTQRDKLEKQVLELETQALSLEERADFSEREASVRKRMKDAENRIRQNQPQSALDLSSLTAFWKKLPTQLKFLLVVGALVLLLLLVGKSCTGSG